MTSDYHPIPGYKANIRDRDNRVLGVVTDRYKVVQNAEAFAFTNALLGEGVKYETAGSLNDGRKVWILAKLPDKYIIEFLVSGVMENGHYHRTNVGTPQRLSTDLQNEIYSICYQ